MCGAWLIDPEEPTPVQLADMLSAQAAGDLGREAGVELLIQHGHWLKSTSFRGFIDAYLGYRPGSRGGTDVPMAQILWPTVNRALNECAVPASSSELAVLRLAGSLANRELSVNLRDSLTGLDRTNSALVTNAVKHAAGLHC